MKTDSELLEAFAGRRDQGAFAQIVARYGNLVYSAARRQVGPAQAEDVAQAVFFILSQKAAKVDGRLLAGWLVRAARLAGMAAGRMEQRRKLREEKAAVVNQQIASEQQDAQNAARHGVANGAERAAWNDISPLLDEAMARLGEQDRCAVTLRFLQGKSVREVAAAMNVSEEAAGKRALRAVNKLRDYFARRGIENLSGESLGNALTSFGIAAAPLGLAAKLTATGAGGAAATSLTAGGAAIAKGTLTLMVTAKAKMTFVVAVAICLAGGSGVLIVKQLTRPSTRTVQVGGITPPGAPAAVVLRAMADQQPAVPAPATQPIAPEVLTRFATPAGQAATFSGRVEGVVDAKSAEIGIIYLRGVHWLNAANYQWSKLGPDGTFSVTADKYPNATKSLAVRAKGQAATYFRADFGPTESAKEIVVKMTPTRMITLMLKDSGGLDVPNAKVEIFSGDRFDEQGRPLSMQRLEAATAVAGVLAVRVPLDTISFFITGDRIAPYFQTVDPRYSDRYELNLLRPAHITGTLKDHGKPVANQRVLISNDAIDLSSVNVKTNGAGQFSLRHGAPGMCSISVRGKHLNVQVNEGENTPIEIELSDPKLADENAPPTETTQPVTTDASTTQPIATPAIQPAG